MAKAIKFAATSPELVIATAASRNTPQKFSPDEAVALFIVNGKQSKAMYHNMYLAARWKSE